MRHLPTLVLLGMLALAPRESPAQLQFPASPPDAAMQFMPCFPDADARADVIGQIGRALRDPVTRRRPDVRSTCSNDSDNPVERLGVWLEPLPPGGILGNGALRVLVDGQRARGLAQVALLQPLELFAWSVSAGFIDTLRARVWDALPKRLNTDGAPDRDGSIRLRSLAVVLDAPDRIRTTVTGSYDILIDTIPFSLVIVETLSIDSDGKVAVEATVAPGGPLKEIVAAVLEVFAPGVLRGGLVGVQTPGSAIATLVPDERMNVGETKLDFYHTRLAVAADAATGGGAADFVFREPWVGIEGARDSVFDSRSGTLTYHAVTYDLRGTDDEPLLFEWRVDGQPLENATGDSVPITFRIPRDVAPGEEDTHTIRVTVTDADGLTATRSITLRILYERGGVPAVCHAKPHLPGCPGAGPGPDTD